MEKMVVVLLSADDGRFMVSKKVAMEIPLIKEKLLMDLEKGEEDNTYRLPWITKRNLALLLNCIIFSSPSEKPHRSQNDVASYMGALDIVCIFNLVQAAYFLDIKFLMDRTFQVLAEIVMRLSAEFYIKRGEAMLQSLIDQHDSQIFRNRKKLTFIDDSDFVDVQYSPFVRSQFFFIKRWKSTFKDHYREVVESKSIEQLVEALNRLEKLVEKDLRSDYCITARVAIYLVKILKKSESEYRKDIQFPVITILSHARSTVCPSVVEEHIIPTLVNLMSGQWNAISLEAVIALTRLAYTSPEGIKAIVDKGALEAAHEEVKCARGGYDSIVSLANFLAAICRGYSLSSDNLSCDKVGLVHSILVDLIRHKYPFHDLHIARACIALSYLSYGRCLEIEGEAWNLLTGKLIEFISFADPSIVSSLFSRVASLARDKNLGMMIAGSALGVVGNVARWGTVNQIRSLIKDHQLMICFRRLLCSEFKKFRKETCQIISNLAAQSEKLIKDLFEVELIKLLCDMVENDEPDVKLEAAWAVFNGVGGYNRYKEIDKYPQMVVTKEKTPSPME